MSHLLAMMTVAFLLFLLFQK